MITDKKRRERPKRAEDKRIMLEITQKKRRYKKRTQKKRTQGREQLVVSRH